MDKHFPTKRAWMPAAVLAFASLVLAVQGAQMAALMLIAIALNVHADLAR